MDKLIVNTVYLNRTNLANALDEPISKEEISLAKICEYSTTLIGIKNTLEKNLNVLRVRYRELFQSAFGTSFVDELNSNDKCFKKLYFNIQRLHHYTKLEFEIHEYYKEVITRVKKSRVSDLIPQFMLSFFYKIDEEGRRNKLNSIICFEQLKWFGTKDNDKVKRPIKDVAKEIKKLIAITSEFELVVDWHEAVLFELIMKLKDIDTDSELLNKIKENLFITRIQEPESDKQKPSDPLIFSGIDN